MEGTIKKNKKLKSALNIVFWVVLGFVAVYSVIALFSTPDSITPWFGKTGLTVITDSMEPTFYPGDLILVDVIEDDEDFDFSTLAKDDIITFRAVRVNDDGIEVSYLNSHRIESVTVDVNGTYKFFTKGDNASPDPEPVTEDYVVAVYTGVKIDKIGGIIDSVQSFLVGPVGFFIFIVLPCFGFLVYEVFNLQVYFW